MPQMGATHRQITQRPEASSALSNQGWLSSYLLGLPGWALVGRHGIWMWSPPSL